MQFKKGTWMELKCFIWKSNPASEDDCGVSVVDESVVPAKDVKIKLKSRSMKSSGTSCEFSHSSML